jgi:hypothetical protein
VQLDLLVPQAQQVWVPQVQQDRKDLWEQQVQQALPEQLALRELQVQLVPAEHKAHKAFKVHKAMWVLLEQQVLLVMWVLLEQQVLLEQPVPQVLLEQVALVLH